jgi:hypothetical protein
VTFVGDAQLAEVQLQRGGQTLFQKGHPRYGGRKKGVHNRFGGDLRVAVVAGIAAVGFIEEGEDGKLKATGRGGVLGFAVSSIGLPAK